MSDSPIIGRYEIVEELGRGAMGSVYKAHDPAMGRTVALKTILSSALTGPQAGEYRERFYREARAAGSLAHPGIVPVFDVGEHGGLPYLVMEFVEGRTLADAAKKGERFTVDRVCDIGQQLADALAYAHRQGVIHRDIKPANILMTSREVYGSERPRITDFGIAKLIASEMTSTGQLLGTPTFMPPEQFTGAPVDGRADLFSLGVILYALSTGEQPFHGETMTAVSYKIVHTDPIPPSKLNPSVSPPLEAVILKCLAKNPAVRYQTGEEIVRDLSEIRANIGAAAMRAFEPTVLTIGDSDQTLAVAPGAISLNAARNSTPPEQILGAPSTPGPVSPRVNPARAAARPAIPARPAMAIAAIAAAAVIVLAAAGWFLLRPRSHAPSVPPTAQATPSTASPAPSSAASSQAPVTAAAKPAAAVPAESGTPPVASAFNPHALNPATNARLRIDLSHIPDGLPLTIDMNGNTYLHAVTGKSDLDHLYVPPGVQRFRVAIRTGGRERLSNIVSDDFRPGKHNTLKIQFLEKRRFPFFGSDTPGKNAQLFLSLR
jgi:serine/threonine protein kinase